jgi:hypothetical protein
MIVIGSFATYAWLITASIPEIVSMLAAWLPVFLVVAGINEIKAHDQRLEQLGKYIRKVEGYLAYDGLGWETNLAKKESEKGICGERDFSYEYHHKIPTRYLAFTVCAAIALDLAFVAICLAHSNCYQRAKFLAFLG